MNKLLAVVALSSFSALAQEAAVTDAGVELAPVAMEVDAGVVDAAPKPEKEKEKEKVSVGMKFGDGVTVKSGAFSLNLRGRVQLQAISLIPTEGSTAVRQNAIYARRARLALKGELPYDLSFTLQLAFANLDMESDAPNVLRDFYVEWKRLRDASVRVGQTKVPFGVQRVVSSSSLQMVDRSVVTGELNLDRDVGLIVFSDDLFGLDGRLRYAAGVFGGDGRNRIGTNVGLLYSARVRFSPFGKFDDKFEGDPDRDHHVRFAIGGSVARNVQTNRPRGTTGTPFQVSTFDYTHAGADLHFKWNGLSLLSEFFWRQADSESGSGVVKGVTVTEYSRSAWGWYAQGGAYVLPWLELTARYGDYRPIQPTDPNLHRTREIGGGVNFMIEKHNLKLQTDYFWLDNGLGGNGRHQIRLQAQVFF